jgi:hypothetical protein
MKVGRDRATRRELGDDAFYFCCESCCFRS